MINRVLSILLVALFSVYLHGVCIASDLRSFDEAEPFNNGRVITKEAIIKIVKGYSLHTPVNIGKPDLIYKIDVFTKDLLKNESVEYLHAFLKRHDLKERALIEAIQRVINEAIYLLSSETDDKRWTTSKVNEVLSSPYIIISRFGLYDNTDILKDHLLFYVVLYHHESYLDREYDIAIDSTGEVRCIGSEPLRIEYGYKDNLNKVLKKENLKVTKDNIIGLTRLFVRERTYEKWDTFPRTFAILGENDLQKIKDSFDEKQENSLKCLEEKFSPLSIEEVSNGFKIKYITLNIEFGCHPGACLIYSIYKNTIMIGINGEIISEEKDEIKCE